VHDYQLMLVPHLLRQRIPGAQIGFFLHIPFPASEVFRTLPWRDEILEGILGADLIGFHTHTYRDHFSSAILRVLGISTTGDRVHHAGRDIRLGVYAMGIDSGSFTALADDPEVTGEVDAMRAQARGERILLGIDRLDYTKGIPRRLLAYERLLEREPSLRGRIRLVQLAVPSRDKVESYQQARAQVNELVGRINGTFGSVHWTPIHYVYRSLTQKQVVALYRSADVMLVTPLRDGMNLVAKEFVTCRTDEDGVLVLSEFAGAAAEMGEAVQVNPYDIDGVASGMAAALAMPDEERKLRMRALRQRIVLRDVHGWARTFVDALSGTQAVEAPARELSTRETIDAIARRLHDAERLLLLLDYDGTLVPFARAPELAAPDRELYRLLGALAEKPNVELHVVSGRTRATLDRWLGKLPVGLHAEHGFWSRIKPGDEWTSLDHFDPDWKSSVRDVFERFTASTPGSLLEEKTVCMAWHYRMAEPELAAARAEELTRELGQRMAEFRFELLHGEKAIEVRPPGATNAAIVGRILPSLARATVICAMGDDGTDDDLFRALPDDAITVSVGYRSTGAKYRVSRPAAARALLARILES
jgi:trehalose 6-phosphate synthase/phosphatase